MSVHPFIKVSDAAHGPKIAGTLLLKSDKYWFFESSGRGCF